MTERTVYFHIGAGKTGTSAIQARLPQLRPLLLERNVYYPEDTTQSEVQAKMGKVSSGNALTLARISNKALPRPKEWEKERAIRWLDEIFARGVESDCNILFSNEHLQFSTQDGLKLISDRLCDHGYKPSIVFYCRTALDYSVSAYLQGLKLGRFPEGKGSSLESYLNTEVVPFGRTVQVYASVFGAESISVYNYEACKDNVVSHFLSQVLSLDIHADLPKSKVNRSLTAVEQLIFEKLSTTENGKEICRLVGQRLDTFRVQNYKKPIPRSIHKDTYDVYVSRNEPIVNYINDTFSVSGGPVQVVNADSDLKILGGTEADEVCPEDLHSIYSSFLNAVYLLRHKHGGISE